MYKIELVSKDTNSSIKRLWWFRLFGVGLYTDPLCELDSTGKPKKNLIFYAIFGALFGYFGCFWYILLMFGVMEGLMYWFPSCFI